MTRKQTLITYKNIRVQIRQKYLNSSRDKESNGTQFLYFRATTTKLLPYNKGTTSFFYEIRFLH